MMKNDRIFGLIFSFLMMVGGTINASPGSYEVWREGYDPSPIYQSLRDLVPEAQGISESFRCVDDTQTTMQLGVSSYKLVSILASDNAKGEKRTFKNYAPASDTWPVIGVLTITQKEKLPNILDKYWSTNGFSANDIFFNEAVVTYANIALAEKAQMVGPANAFSWSVLLMTEDGKKASQPQIKALLKRKEQIEQLSGRPITIDWVGDMFEARGYKAGTIENIEAIRLALGSKKLEEVGAPFTAESVAEKLKPITLEKEALRASA